MKKFLVLSVILCTIVALFSSCEDAMTDEVSVKSQNEVEKTSLEWSTISNNDTVVVAEEKSTVSNNDTTATITAAISCAQYSYSIPRDKKELDAAFCNRSENNVISGLNTHEVTADFTWEDGNVCTITVRQPMNLGNYRGTRRPYYTVEGVRILSLRNVAQRGDTLTTEVTAEVTYKSVGINVKRETMILRDRVTRIMVAEADYVIAKIYQGVQEVISDTQIEQRVVKTSTWKSGKTTDEVVSIQLLPYSIQSFDAGEKEVTAWGSLHTENFTLTKGSEATDASDITPAEGFTAFKKRVDTAAGLLIHNDTQSLPLKYLITVRGCTFHNSDTTIVFTVPTVNVEETGNTLTPTTGGSVANAEYREARNHIRVTVLGWMQSASEAGKLYKKKAEVPTAHWNKELSSVKVDGSNVIYNGAWISYTSPTDSTVEMVKNILPRKLTANSWEIITANQANKTGNSVTATNTAEKTAGEWKYTVLVTRVVQNVNFIDGMKQNIFDSTEYQDVSVTRNGKTLRFANYEISFSEATVSGPTANGTKDGYNVFKQNTTVVCSAGQNKQKLSATAKGTILVEPEEEPFFPSSYGKFLGAAFSATIDPLNRNQWYYGCSVRFEKGTLAVPINRKGEPQWEEGKFWAGVTDTALNGAYYAKGEWYPVISKDINDGMEWSLCKAQGSYCLHILDYAGADTYGDWNNNDLNSRGQHTVITKRLEMKHDASKRKMTLYYNGKDMGSWIYGAK